MTGNLSVFGQEVDQSSAGPIGEFVSFVVPVHNEEAVLEKFHREFREFLTRHRFHRYQLLFVDDGSTDRSPQLLRRLAAADRSVQVITLSRNFGKEVALTAGLDHAAGDAVIPIDADLQHPFPVILAFIRQWRAGHDVVCGVQQNRRQGLLRKTCSSLYHRIVAGLCNQPGLYRNAGDFRLLSRRAVDRLNQMRERHRIMKGLYPLVGLRHTAVYFNAADRAAGSSRWNWWKLANLGMDGLTSATTAPLRLATMFGLLCAALAMAMAVWTVCKTLMFGEPVAGFPTLISVVLFLGSVQLVSLGIIGEYLGRIFNETKNRPLYFVDEVYGGESAQQAEREKKCA